MMSQLANINWISVLIAFVAYTILGGVWFTVLFKKQYAISLGKENELPAKPAPIFIIGPAVCSFIITITSALLLYALGLDTYSQAMGFAFIVGGGYLVANTFNIAINPNIPYPIHYGIISGAYHLVGIFIVSIVLVAMR
ncbi:DUF1761 domain-containing protein [Adhaeribacter pallidiroseus]|uniref:DUF1761 domain-containing protein n=1 Tax=Adhaeribacter pallidiroseus TaxID=2072847 RepID=A0A369QBZ8_9BACT|nr:DUF1761 domain-containing protein [Adhaeribacter pallidiroseus]RDC62423.1 hypothetical protein AHMF7616_01017 [Adhaeribacter pallidiroseus]